MSSRNRPFLPLALLLALATPQSSQAQIVIFDESGIVIVDNTQLIATGDSLSIQDLAQGKTGISGAASLEAAWGLDPTLSAPTTGTGGSRTLGINTLDPYYYAELDVVTEPNAQGSISIVGDPGGATEHVYLAGDTTELVSVTSCTGLSYTPDFASHVATLSSLSLDGGSSTFFGDTVDTVGASPSCSFRLFVCVETGQWAVAYDAVEQSFDSLSSKSLDALVEQSLSQSGYTTVSGLVNDAETSFHDIVAPATSGADAATDLEDLQDELVVLLSDGDLTDEALAARLDADAQRVLDALATNANYAVTLVTGSGL